MLSTSWKPERAASSSSFSKKPVVVEGSEGAGVETCRERDEMKSVIGDRCLQDGKCMHMIQ